MGMTKISSLAVFWYSPGLPYAPARIGPLLRVTARAARSARCSTQDKERPSCSLAAALEGIRCACWRA